MSEKADDREMCEAMAEEVLNEIKISPEPYNHNVMLEPWGGQFTREKPALALSAIGEA